jgi:hypothetical protein
MAVVAPSDVRGWRRFCRTHAQLFLRFRIIFAFCKRKMAKGSERDREATFLYNLRLSNAHFSLVRTVYRFTPAPTINKLSETSISIGQALRKRVLADRHN